MAFQIITIPFNSVLKAFNTEDLNAFCLNKKIVQQKVEFFREKGNVFWSVFIEYETVISRNGGDTKGLTEAGRLCYEKLREWRKEAADKGGIPPFVIAKNSHLAEIVNKEITTLEGLKQISGFGNKKGKNTKEIGDVHKYINSRVIFPVLV